MSVDPADPKEGEEAAFRFSLSPAYRGSRRAAMAAAAEDRPQDDDSTTALGRYDLEFHCTFTGSGLLRISFAFPTTWSARACQVASSELYFLLYQFATSFLAFLQGVREESVAQIKLQKWFCCISTKPELRIRRKVSRVLSALVEDSVSTHQNAAERVAEKVSSFPRQVLFPLSTVVSGEMTALAASLHEDQAALRRAEADLYKSALALQAIGVDISELASRIYKRHRLEEYWSLDESLLARLDGIATAVGVWTGLFALAVSLGIIVPTLSTALALIAFALALVWVNRRHSLVVGALVAGVRPDTPLEKPAGPPVADQGREDGPDDDESL